MVNPGRRALLLAALPLGGCAAAPAGPPDGGSALAPRRFSGGFLSVVPPPPGQPPRPGVGPYVRLQAPTALALRGFDLLVADAASARLWRVDLMMQTLTGVGAGAGAPVGPGTALWLGPDRSAWVLDVAQRQVLRFALDGRLLQTWRTGPSPEGLAVLDGGAALVLADPGFGRWTELRSGGTVALTVQPQRPEGGTAAIGALAAGRQHLFVLDAATGAVHRLQRDGRLLDTLGAAPPGRATAMAVDRFDRAWVLDGAGRSVTRLAAGRPAVTLSAADLGAQQLGGLAVDDRSLAVSDRLLGQVLIHPLPSAEAGE